MRKLPYYKQETPFTCSLACLRMVLESIDRKFTEADLVKTVNFNPKIGFSPKMMDVLCDVINVKYEYNFDSALDELRKIIDNGFYPIVLVRADKLYDVVESEHGHYIVIKDIIKESIIINDPDREYGGEDRGIPIEKFLEGWRYLHNFVFVIKGEEK